MGLIIHDDTAIEARNLLVFHSRTCATWCCFLSLVKTFQFLHVHVTCLGRALAGGARAGRGKQVWPSPDVMTNMGAKDALCKIANLGIGLIDTFAYYSPEEFAAGFKKTMAFQPRVIKQNRGSSGEGIWIIKLKSENYCHLACLRLSFFSQLNVYFEGKPNSNQNKK